MNINMKMDLSFGRLCPVFASVALLSLIGCGKSDSAPVAQSQGTTGAVAPSGDASTPAVASGTSGSGAAKEKRKRDEVWTDEKGQKWFGNVPMDAFFDQPYTVASDSTPIGGNAGVADAGKSGVAAEMPAVIPAQSNEDAATNNAAPTEAPMSSALPPETADPTTPGGDEWSGLMPLAMLEEEAKTIRGFLRENLQSVGNYNSSMLMIPPKAATLAVLAGIAMEHPEKVAWKDDAKYVRDLAKQMNASALQRGAKDQKRLSELFDALSSTMDRSKPAGLQEPAESDGFAETAPMNLLMNRMEQCETRLKTEAGTEAALTSRKDMALLESSILGSIAKVITKPGYGYEDDEEFKGFANEVVASTLAMKTAAESGDFSGFEAAMTKVSTTCTNCHGKYRSE
jgi:soluble cytochrome b562